MFIQYLSDKYIQKFKLIIDYLHSDLRELLLEKYLIDNSIIEFDNEMDRILN